MSNPYNLPLDIEFTIRLMEWAKRNGIPDGTGEIEALFALLSEYLKFKEEPKSSATPTKYKALRMERGLKAVEVAEATGLSKVYISYIENGHIKNMRPDYKKRLDDFYGLAE